MQSNRWGALLSLGMLGAVMWPIQQNWRNKPQDSFPLSYYPMFSQKREAKESVFYAVGLDAQGGRHYIPSNWVGEGGHNQARKQLKRIIKEDRGAEMAKSIAKRLARQTEEPWSKLASVSVVTGEFVIDDFFHGKKSPVSERVLGTSKVKRKGEKDYAAKNDK